MMKWFTLLLVMMTAASVSASLDYKSDSFGIYFDVQNVNYCNPTATLFAPFPVYLVLMNPVSATNGFECTVTRTGPANCFILSTTLSGVGALDVDASADGYMVGCAADYPTVHSGCTLVTWSYMLTSPGYVYLYIGPGTVPSLTGGQPVVTGNGVLRRCEVWSGDVHLPCGAIGTCPYPAEAAAFGSVKSLFR